MYANSNLASLAAMLNYQDVEVIGNKIICNGWNRHLKRWKMVF